MIDQELVQKVQELEFLDFSVMLGRPAVPFTGFFAEKEDALAEMDRVGIKDALAYHTTAKGYQSVYGNERLINETGEIKRLIPSWVVVPDEDEMGCNPTEFIARMRANNVRVVRMFPSAQSNPFVATRYAFSKWFYGDFMEAFESEHIPVALEFSPHRRAEPEWEKLYALANDYPKLPIVLCDAFQRATWSLVKLMKLMPNIYIQTGSVGVHRQLEYMVNKVGAERFVAGSKFPD